ncbi:MAG: hypothetical protein U0168_19740 [Nannocystaceae bacterium]
MRGVGLGATLAIAGCFSNAPAVTGAEGGSSSSGTTQGSDGTQGSSSGTSGAGMHTADVTTDKSDSSSGELPEDMGTMPQQHGEIMVRSSLSSQQGSVWRIGFGGGAEGCAPMGAPEGACQHFRCPAAGEPTPHAGAIALHRDGAPVGGPATPDGLGHYPPVPFADSPFGPDDLIEFIADGAELPPFDGSLVAPASLNLSQPAADAVPSAVTGLDIAWPPGAPGQRVTLRMRAADHLLVCAAGADTGALSVAPASLASLVGAFDYAVTLEQGSEILAGDWVVQLTVGIVARGSDDEAVAGMLSL